LGRVEPRVEAGKGEGPLTRSGCDSYRASAKPSRFDDNRTVAAHGIDYQLTGSGVGVEDLSRERGGHRLGAAWTRMWGQVWLLVIGWCWSRWPHC